MPDPKPRIKPARRIPIAAARRIAEQYGMDQVILLAWTKRGARTHFVSYGKDRENCRDAAQGVDRIVRYLGLEEESS